MVEKYKIRLKDLPVADKPREKLSNLGPSALDNAELLAVILGKGTRKEGVLETARRIIENYGSMALTGETSVTKVQQAFGVGYVHACQIVACFELGRRFFGRKKEVSIRTPQEGFEYLKPMCRLGKEHFRGLYLDVTNRLIHDEIITIGTLTTNLIHPREIFYPAIKHSAAAIILAHNHPSGDPSPSEDDIKVTRQILTAAETMDIDILDHLVIGDQLFVSLKEKGLM